jgi:hypothetical protein
MLTEFGGKGQWEAGKTPWGAPIEPSSTEKARMTIQAYTGGVLPALEGAQPAAAAGAAAGGMSSAAAAAPAALSPALLQQWRASGQVVCVGAFAFYGGHKVEVTPTWYSLWTPGGEPAADRMAVLSWLWRGYAPDPRAVGEQLGSAFIPHIDGIRFIEPVAAVRPNPTLRPGDTVAVQALLRAHGPWVCEWVIRPEVNMAGAGGHGAPMPPDLVRVVAKGTNASIAVPPAPGAYRLYAYVRAEGRPGVATANAPFQVAG